MVTKATSDGNMVQLQRLINWMNYYGLNNEVVRLSAPHRGGKAIHPNIFKEPFNNSLYFELIDRGTNFTSVCNTPIKEGSIALKVESARYRQTEPAMMHLTALFEPGKSEEAEYFFNSSFSGKIDSIQKGYFSIDVPDPTPELIAKALKEALAVFNWNVEIIDNRLGYARARTKEPLFDDFHLTLFIDRPNESHRAGVHIHDCVVGESKFYDLYVISGTRGIALVDVPEPLFEATPVK